LPLIKKLERLLLEVQQHGIDTQMVIKVGLKQNSYNSQKIPKSQFLIYNHGSQNLEKNHIITYIASI
jgi:hypothetical protein